MSFGSWRIRPARRGGYDLHLPDEERELLAVLPGRILPSLEDVSEHSVPEPLERLFPPAYLIDEGAETIYRRLEREKLAEHHREALELLSATCQSSHLDDETAQGWLVALTGLRLVLGNALGVSEDEHELDPDDPDYVEWVCYHYLSGLQHELVGALTEQLPPPSDDGTELPEDPWGEPPGGLRWDGTDLPEEP